MSQALLVRKKLVKAVDAIQAAVLMLALMGPISLLAQTVPQPGDTKRLEVAEELSESLANDLLTLSVAARDRDIDLIAEYFPAQVAGKALPSSPTQTRTQVKWVGVHGWESPQKMIATASQPNTPKKEFIASWSSFLDHFSEIEDARFKVKEANFDPKAQAVLGAAEPTAVLGASGRACLLYTSPSPRDS